MSLNTLDTTIANLREKAADLINSHRQFEASVLADPALTLEGKNQRLDGRKDQVRADVAALEAREKSAIAAEIQSLERAIGGTAGSAGSNVVSFRDAQDRAARAATPEDALVGLKSAITTDDRELARAYLMRAVTERDQDPIAQAFGDTGAGDQWSQVVQAYIDAYPATADAVVDLFTLRRRERSAQNNFMSAGAYVVL